jgi:hypothetical protein
VELFLIWVSGLLYRVEFYLAALPVAVSAIAFLATFICRRFFLGTLSDPNGIPPAYLKLFGTVLSIDINLAAVIAALLSLIASVDIIQV